MKTAKAEADELLIAALKMNVDEKQALIDLQDKEIHVLRERVKALFRQCSKMHECHSIANSN